MVTPSSSSSSSVTLFTIVPGFLTSHSFHNSIDIILPSPPLLSWFSARRYSPFCPPFLLLFSFSLCCCPLHLTNSYNFIVDVF